MEPAAVFAMRKAADFIEASATFQGPQQLAKGNFAFATHNLICPCSFVGFWGKTRVITTHDDFQRGLE